MPKKDKKRKDTKLESEGAEFLVLGQLLIQGVAAYKTYTNLPGYDLPAYSARTKRTARIQVKSRWATDAPHFLVRNADDCDFVVLVRLNRGCQGSSNASKEDTAVDPEYYVLSADEANALLAGKETRWSKIRWDKGKFDALRRRWDLVQYYLEERA